MSEDSSESNHKHSHVFDLQVTVDSDDPEGRDITPLAIRRAWTRELATIDDSQIREQNIPPGSDFEREAVAMEKAEAPEWSISEGIDRARQIHALYKKMCGPAGLDAGTEEIIADLLHLVAQSSENNIADIIQTAIGLFEHQRAKELPESDRRDDQKNLVAIDIGNSLDDIESAFVEACAYDSGESTGEARARIFPDGRDLSHKIMALVLFERAITRWL